MRYASPRAALYARSERAYRRLLSIDFKRGGKKLAFQTHRLQPCIVRAVGKKRAVSVKDLLKRRGLIEATGRSRGTSPIYIVYRRPESLIRETIVHGRRFPMKPKLAVIAQQRVERLQLDPVLRRLRAYFEDLEDLKGTLDRGVQVTIKGTECSVRDL